VAANAAFVRASANSWARLAVDRSAEKDIRGQTPLHYAMVEHEALARWLRRHGGQE
jgi:hypothetical protein